MREWLLHEGPAIPVIAMSGYADDSPGTRRGLPEEVRFVRKPFTPADLVNEVRRAIDGA